MSEGRFGEPAALVRAAPTQVAIGARVMPRLVRCGVVRVERPDRLVRALRELSRLGATPVGAYAAAARRHPDEVAIVDEAGELTFGQAHRRTNALARAFAGQGIGPRDAVALLCRDHRWFIEASVALGKLGATILYCNTAFAAPRLKQVVDREQPTALILVLGNRRRMHGVRLDDGRVVEAAPVVVGLGVSPATGRLEGEGLCLDDGVIRDETRAAVGAPGVVAAGEVASLVSPSIGPATDRALGQRRSAGGGRRARPARRPRQRARLPRPVLLVGPVRREAAAARRAAARRSSTRGGGRAG